MYCHSLGDFKRSQTRDALSYKLGALLELAEKTVVLGSIGKLLVDEIQLDRTEPGGQRVWYEGQARTDQLMSEAQRCVSDVVFNPLPDGQNPESSPMQHNGGGQYQQDYQDHQDQGHQQGDYGSYRHNGYEQSPEVASPRGDYGLAYPNATALPELERQRSFSEDFSTPVYDNHTTSNFASQARDRSSLAYMGGGDDEHVEQAPPMPSNAAANIAANAPLSPIQDEDTQDVTYQRELQQEQDQHRAWEEQRQNQRSSHEQEQDRYQYDDMRSPEVPYAPINVNGTPAMGSYGHVESPASPAYQGHVHDKSLEPLVPSWGAQEEPTTSISYNAPSKPATYTEERPYVPKPNDGAYHGPSLDPPPSASSVHGGNNSRGGSSVGGSSSNGNQTSPQQGEFRSAFVPQKKERPPPANRGESALGSKYGDLGSSSIGGTTPTGSNTGRFQLGGGATVGAESSGYFRAADATTPGAGMELPSQRIKASAFRRQAPSAASPQYYGAGGSFSQMSNGQAAQSPGGRSAAEEIKEQYRSSAVPMPSPTRSASTNVAGEGGPQDVPPLSINKDKRGSASTASGWNSGRLG